VFVAKEENGETTLRFEISDTGVGIPTGRQALIFDSFRQGDGSSTRRHGGTGLGLAISSRLVRQMGGRMWVDSEPGSGTTFSFTTTFPADESEVDGSEVADPTQHLVDRSRLLRHVGHDEELLDEIVQIFLADARQMVTHLEEALMRGKRGELANAACRLRATLDTLAATPAAESARRLEELARDAEAEQLRDAFDILERRIRQVEGELRRIVPMKNATNGFDAAREGTRS
jgi:HPt (histidine-containing phosphotransfer) domain-containing protein